MLATNPYQPQVFTPRQYQQESIDAGVEFFQSHANYNAFQILPTGSGKSVIIANIAKELDGKTIVFQPSKEILEQNLKKFQSYGFRAGVYSASAGQKVVDQITFSTIGSAISKAHLFRDVKNIIVDECFPAGSLIDEMPIENIKVGNVVRSFNHLTDSIEYKKVVRLFKKKINTDLIIVKLTDGTEFICTDNHPIYTNELGYIPARLLFLSTDISLTVIKNEPQNNIPLSNLPIRMQKEITHKNGFYLLQSGMQDTTTCATNIENSNQLQFLSKRNNNRKNKKSKFFKRTKNLLFKGMFFSNSIQWLDYIRKENARIKRMEGTHIQSNEEKQSNVDAGRERKNDRILKGKNFSFQGGQRPIDKTSIDVASCNRISNGVSNRNTSSKTFISIGSTLLQSRFSNTGGEAGYRSGWCKSQVEKMAFFGPQKNRNIERVRVASAEIYKFGSGIKNQQVCEENYVYNIEVEDNHNYFVSNTLVHNCHLVNSEAGMYHNFIHSIPGAKVLGLTATPYRLTSGSDGASLEFLNRTTPRIFKKLIYYVQNDVLFNAGHLAKLRYFNFNVIDRSMLEMNAAGTDFTDASLKSYYKEIDMPALTAQHANSLLSQRKNLLIFCSLISEAYEAAAMIHGAVVLTGKTTTDAREKILSQFKKGIIRCVINVGVITTGFDYPELESVLLARSTMSLALYYQIVGRGMRPNPDKESCWIVDLGGNIKFFGKIETMKIKQDDRGLYSIWNNNRQLTNVSFRKE